MRFLILIFLMLPLSARAETVREWTVADQVIFVDGGVTYYTLAAACNAKTAAYVAQGQPIVLVAVVPPASCTFQNSQSGYQWSAGFPSYAGHCPEGFTRDTSKAPSDPQACWRDVVLPDCSDTAGQEVTLFKICTNYLCSVAPTFNEATGKWFCPSLVENVVPPPATINYGGCKANLLKIVAITDKVAGTADGSPPPQSGSYLCEVMYVTTAEKADGPNTDNDPGDGAGPKPPDSGSPAGAGNAPGSGSGDGGEGGDGGGGGGGGGNDCTPEMEKLGLCKKAEGSAGNGGTPGAGQQSTCTAEMKAAGKCDTNGTYTAPTTCEAPPVCDGDPILCGIAKQHWQAVCSLVEITDTDRTTIETTIKTEQDKVKAGVESYNAKAQGLFTTFQQSVDQKVTGQAWCPPNVVVTVFGKQITFPFGKPEVCDVFKLMRLFMLLGAYIQAMRIVLGGIK